VHREEWFLPQSTQRVSSLSKRFSGWWNKK
jgi:hypothetical protein